MIDFKSIAEQYHTSINQLYGTKPYIYHLEAVVKVLKDHNITDQDIINAAWCHDILEDVPNVTPEDLVRQGLSQRSLDIVKRVTDQPASTRKERKLKTYPIIAASENAIIVKLADRIANINESLNSQTPRNTYIKEHNDFLTLYNPNHNSCLNLWNTYHNQMLLLKAHYNLINNLKH